MAAVKKGVDECGEQQQQLAGKGHDEIERSESATSMRKVTGGVQVASGPALGMSDKARPSPVVPRGGDGGQVARRLSFSLDDDDEDEERFWRSLEELEGEGESVGGEEEDEEGEAEEDDEDEDPEVLIRQVASHERQISSLLCEYDRFTLARSPHKPHTPLRMEVSHRSPRSVVGQAERALATQRASARNHSGEPEPKPELGSHLAELHSEIASLKAHVDVSLHAALVQAARRPASSVLVSAARDCVFAAFASLVAVLFVGAYLVCVSRPVGAFPM